MEKDSTTLKTESKICLNERQKKCLYKEKGRADFDDRFIQPLISALSKDGLKYGWATNYTQTRMAFMTHGQNAIVVYDANGNYQVF